MFTFMAKRTYTQKRRAENKQDTRRRIVEAAVELHGTLGPKATTISAIAERAGVQRLTVYRHFPDDITLFEACTAHWLDDHPLPDPTSWANEKTGTKRTEKALMALYGYYRSTRDMWALGYRDAPDVPALTEPLDAVRAYLDAVRDDLFQAFRPTTKRKAHVRSTLTHALKFQTWQSLADEGLSDPAIARLILSWLE